MSSSLDNYIVKEMLIIGAGISGIAVAKWVKQYDFDFTVLEKSDDFGGVWRYRDDDYGVAKFTRINVSKYNFHYSDLPFPESTPEFMHNTEIYDYVGKYVEQFQLKENIQFQHQVLQVQEFTDTTFKPKFPKLTSYDKLWEVTVKDLLTNTEKKYITANVCVCTGHHRTPRVATFPGQETFPGEMFHSVKYKSATFNKLNGKRVLLIGIGDSSVDIADNLVTEGACPKVSISTRSGAWIFPVYICGFPLDLYDNRFQLKLPWQMSSNTFEMIIKLIYGDPNKYGLNPKVRALQSQPTVSATLVNHLQRNLIHIKRNVKSIAEEVVTFEDGSTDAYDAIIACTGYKINLGFLHADLRKLVFKDTEENALNLYKAVYQPDIGQSLSFIGYIQPHTGGIINISEIQARWIVYTMFNMTRLPDKQNMYDEIEKDSKKFADRFYKSERHTIQNDAMAYIDEVSSFFGATPSLLTNLPIAWRLIFGSIGPSQWRLNGPDADPEATSRVLAVPIPGGNLFRNISIVLILLLIGLLLSIVGFISEHPFVFACIYFTLLAFTREKFKQKKKVADNLRNSKRNLK